MRVWRAIFCAGMMVQPVLAATYYVSPSGDAGNPGTSEEKPLKEVQAAIDLMAAGDTLVVLDGVYPETLTLKSGIQIRAKNPRKVIFSGAEVLSSPFTKHAGNVYKAKVDALPEQVFYKGQPMSWAKWPNLDWKDNWIGGKKWVGSAKKGTGPGVLTSDRFSEIKGLNLVGAYCFLRYSKGNSCFSRKIESFDGKVMHWDDSDFYSVRTTGEDGRRGSPAAIKKGKAKANVRARFYLAGALDLLDSGGEWFAKDGFLYFQSPDGTAPDASEVLVKTTDYSILQTSAVSDVSVEGVDFFATSVKMGNRENRGIVFRDVHFSYIGASLLHVDILQSAKTSKPVSVSGSSIRFEKCLFAGAQNTALQLIGEGCVVENCVFLENNRDANFQSRALVLRAEGSFKISRNTFFNNCSDAILIGFSDKPSIEARPQISYNNIFNAGIFNSDVSGIYMPNLSQFWTEVHHNWVHNCNGNGVRLDQAGEKLTVHHNVFWSSKRGMNIEGFGNFNIYNNTSVLNEEACALTRNVVTKRKGTGTATVSNDTSFPPIVDWVVVNNLVQEFVDRVGPSELGPYTASQKKKLLHPERAKQKTLPIEDRGDIQGNITGFPLSLFVSGSLENLNLIPADPSVENGVASTAALVARGVVDLAPYRGAYGVAGGAWNSGSDWLPYHLKVPGTMAESEAFAKAYRTVSVVPELGLNGLSPGVLSAD